MHPTEQRRNLTRTLNLVLAGLDLDGAELVPADDERVPGLDLPAWVRISVLDVRQQYAGRLQGDKATREDQKLVVEVWHQNNQAQAEATVDAVDALAETIASYFRYQNLPLLDCVADPADPPAIEGATLRFLQPPTIKVVPAEAGYQRRIVECPFTFFSRKE